MDSYYKRGYTKYYNVAPEIVVGLLRESEKYLHKQQTPNPDAHVPDAVPPNFEQSDEL